MDIEKMLEIESLYSQYASLLTDKQRDIISMYYDEDYSLGEISQILKISRQSVYDSLKRSETALKDYESKLGMIDKMKQIEIFVNSIEKCLCFDTENTENITLEIDAERVTQLKVILDEIKELI
ncbi:YlxM family DNA-binding protein [Peptostreptococcus porci]|uniref:YlxM family DNA-binding protein n=1 Tax=Peptostreptococcus porci TaxID=2652282 RepID=UPI0023EFB918|nr:sigma factor-like helix-turn-helix DNA-binding protein [Peptostreptococcus porci]MDD7183015.1 sigma factor-like helix-turn-helix DNA-binding protein [Peptostreptococcus porci]